MTHALCARIAVLPSDDGHYPWTVSRSGIQTSPDYNFWYIDGFYETDPVEVNRDNHFTSAYFQITNASNPSPTTSGAASTSATGLPAKTETSTSSPQSSAPVGAIVGGVVGGLAVVGLTVIAALLLLRRRKGAQDQTQPQTQTMDNYPYGPVPVPGQDQMNRHTQNGSYNPHLQSGIAMKTELPASTGFSTRSAMSELHS
ncbi:hypothetical protein VTN00DRAFT_3678 [Thermoascus crustaceus]|uniref:uncharacterized protein n=1 Tax=Thermoascus crustaceus TaxID=5088 RepID=UPI00374232A7